MKNLFWLLFLLIGVASCKEEDTVNSTAPIFTFTIPPDPENSFWRNDWIVVRDNETGKLLDARAITDNEPVEFRTKESLSGNKITVSHLQMGDTRIWTTFCHINVYSGVDVGSKWTLTSRTSNKLPTDNPVSGNYSLSIDNVPPLYGFSVSNGLSGSDFADVKGGRLTGKFSARQMPIRSLVMIDPNGTSKPKYAWIDDVNKNEAFQLDYNQFNEFDNYLNIKFPATTQIHAELVGVGDETYTTYNNFHWGRGEIETSELHVGLLNTFSTYKLTLQVDDFGYRSQGPAPQSVNITADTSTYSYKVSNYLVPLNGGPAGQTTYSMTWYAPPGSTLHDVLTPGLFKMIGKKQEDLKYWDSSFLLYGQAYEDKLRYVFDPEFERPETYQIAWLGQYFTPF